MRKILSTIMFAGAALAAVHPASAAVPTIDSIVGDYIQSDSTQYADSESGITSTMWEACKGIEISRVEGSDNAINISGLWRSLRGENHTIEATFSSTSGNISIPAGTVVWLDNDYSAGEGGTEVTGQSEIKIYACEYTTDESGQAIEEWSKRPIIFRYDENTGRWWHEGYIVVTRPWPSGETGELVETAVDYMYNLTIIRANGTVTNESYSFSSGSIVEYGEETRPCYVDNDGSILNLLTTDQYGFGALAHYEVSGDMFTIPAAPIASVTDLTYSYKVLAGVDIDPDTQQPSLTDQMDITGQIIESDGTRNISFSPSAIFYASYDAEMGAITIDPNVIQEVVRRLEISYVPEETASVGNITASDNIAKEVERVEYYDLHGRRLPDATATTGVIIKKTIYTDGSFSTDKAIVE